MRIYGQMRTVAMSEKTGSGKYVTAILLALFAVGLFSFTLYSGLK